MWKQPQGNNESTLSNQCKLINESQNRLQESKLCRNTQK